MEPDIVTAQHRDPFSIDVGVPRPAYPRTGCEGVLVAILRTLSDDRGLELIDPPTRCVRRYDIHELILTDDADAKPGARVDRAAYLGFVEFDRGGVISAGDTVTIDDAPVGEIAGFDETHMPNHINILLRGPNRIPGTERGLALGSRVKFVPRPVPDAAAIQARASVCTESVQVPSSSMRGNR